VVVSIGGLVEIVPLMYQAEVTSRAGREAVSRAAAGRARHLRARRLLQLPLADGAPLRGETERYGHYSLAGESVYDHPFQWGSKRTGPDLARVGGRYSDDWHRVHLNNPRDVVPESNMPGFPWLALRMVGVPYGCDEQIAAAQPRCRAVPRWTR
jgi:cytochrome c oxidase cbb3-type subunit 2